jgi:hypothetical protein
LFLAAAAVAHTYSYGSCHGIVIMCFDVAYIKTAAAAAESERLLLSVYVQHSTAAAAAIITIMANAHTHMEGEITFVCHIAAAVAGASLQCDMSALNT